MHQIVHAFNLTCGMPQKCIVDIFPFDTASVVRNPDQCDPAVFNFYCDGICPGVDRIFCQFLDNRCLSFNDFSGRDLIDRNLI